MNRIRLLCVAVWVVAMLLSTAACSTEPDCSSPDAWPAQMAFTHLKNAGIVANEDLDFARTQVSQIASEKIGKDLYRQVHLVRYFRKSGEEVAAIVVNEASSQECSMSDGDVFVISRRLGSYSLGK